ncbi:MAG: hypothetical protein ABL878_16970 [Burkholderiales bacterium]
MNDDSLPAGFEDLAAWLSWALPTEHARRAKRAASSMADIRAFYDAMLPRMDAVLHFLSEQGVERVPPDVQRLFLLTAALADIAPAVEMYGEPLAEGLDVLRLTAVDIYPQRA